MIQFLIIEGLLCTSLYFLIFNIINEKSHKIIPFAMLSLTLIIVEIFLAGNIFTREIMMNVSLIASVMAYPAGLFNFYGYEKISVIISSVVFSIFIVSFITILMHFV